MRVVSASEMGGRKMSLLSNSSLPKKFKVLEGLRVMLIILVSRDIKDLA